MTSPTEEKLKAQHRADGETLTKEPDLLAAARRAHTLLVNLEVDAGEYYRETGWLGAAIKAATESVRSPSRRERQWCLKCGTVTVDDKCHCSEVGDTPQFVNYADKLADECNQLAQTSSRRSVLEEAARAVEAAMEHASPVWRRRVVLAIRALAEEN